MSDDDKDETHASGDGGASEGSVGREHENVDDVADAMLDGIMPAKPKKKPAYTRTSQWGAGWYRRTDTGYGGYGRKISSTTRNGGTGGAAVHPSTTDRAGGYPGGGSHGQGGGQSQAPLRETLPKMKPEDIDAIGMNGLVKRAGQGVLDGLENQGYVLIGASESLMARRLLDDAFEKAVIKVVEEMIENDLIRDRYHDLVNEDDDYTGYP